MNRKLRSQLINAAIGGLTGEINRIVLENPEMVQDEEILARAIDSPSVSSMVIHLLNLGWNPNGCLEHFRQPVVVLAAKRGRNDILTELISRGADVNAASDFGQTALLGACHEKSANHVECLKLLLDAGADPNIGRFFSPLMWAVEHGTTDMVELLLDAGAELDRWYGGGNAMLCAINANRLPMVELLLARGANAEAKVPPEATAAFREHPGSSLKEIALKENRSKIVALLNQQRTKSQSHTSTSLQSVWNKLRKQSELAGVFIEDWLNPGLPESDLIAFSIAFKITLPKDVKESLQEHNGQPSNCFSLRLETDREDILCNDDHASLFRIFPISEISAEIQRLRLLRKEIDPAGNFYTSEKGIAGTFWNENWLPLARNVQGDILCCDTNPPLDGIYGQVIIMSSEYAVRARAANSWTDCMDHFQFASWTRPLFQ